MTAPFSRTFPLALAAAALPPLGAQSYTGNLNRGSTVRLTPSRVDAASLLTMCEQLERRAESLKKRLARLTKNSPEPSGAKDPLEADAADLLQSATSLYTSWSFHRDYDRCRRDFQLLLRPAYRIHRALPQHRLRKDLEGEWNGIREDLDELIAVFQLKKIDWKLLQEPPQP